MLFKVSFLLAVLVLSMTSADEVISLTDANFFEFIGQESSLVKFYAPWCGHCKSLAPIYEQSAVTLAAASQQGVLGKLDCTEFRDLCAKYDVKGYPTVLHFSKGEKTGKYDKSRSEKAIVDFMKKKAGIEEEKAVAADNAAAAVLTLTDANFEKFVGQKAALVKFYAPWCGHCKNLAPIYEEAAKFLSEKFSFPGALGEVDCTEYSDICKKYGVKGYPTLHYFSKGEHLAYDRARTMDALVAYMLEKTGQIPAQPLPSEIASAAGRESVVTLTSQNFDAYVKEKDVLVKFYAPWCGHCKKLAPIFETAATKLEQRDIKGSLAKLDCTVHREVCTKYEVKGYPTLLFFSSGGSKNEKYAKARTESDLVGFISEKYGKAEKVEDKGNTESVVTLTGSNFDEFISKDVALVKFYAPWCGHCKSLAPIYEATAKALQDSVPKSLGKVDCTVHQDICSRYEVQGYPTVLFFSKGEKIEKYAKGRDQTAITRYVMNKAGIPEKGETAEKQKIVKEDVNSAVVSLTPDNFDEFITKDTTLIKFYAPWCGHCKNLAPKYETAATKLEKDFADKFLGKVDCTTNQDLCKKFDIKGYPTLLHFSKGKKVEKYSKGRTEEAIVQYIIEKAKLGNHDEL